MNDLILKFQFIDRAGRAVMNMHDYTDRKLGPIVGQMRLTEGEDVSIPLCMIDWAGIESIPERAALDKEFAEPE